LERISKMLGVAIPQPIAELFSKPIVHDLVVPKDRIEAEILSFLEG